MLNRELVYTGLTRARSASQLARSQEIAEAGLARNASRLSGLKWRFDTIIVKIL
jgi:ATP-dependent exoDNAse (exonuclease V) alpha subunit